MDVENLLGSDVVARLILIVLILGMGGCIHDCALAYTHMECRW